MLKNRTVAKLLAATFVVSGVLMAAPAQAQDTGWNKITNTKVDTGWN